MPCRSTVEPEIAQGAASAMNNVQKLREQQLLGKAEFARKAGVSESTLDRVEAGHDCRLETKRKIILALGLSLQQRGKVFRAPAASPPRRGNGRGRGK